MYRINTLHIFFIKKEWEPNQAEKCNGKQISMPLKRIEITNEKKNKPLDRITNMKLKAETKNPKGIKWK